MNRWGSDERADFARTVGHRLAYFRADKGLTQRELADLTGLPARNIERWERGTFLVPLDAWLLIADALRVPLTKLRPPRGT